MGKKGQPIEREVDREEREVERITM